MKRWIVGLVGAGLAAWGAIALAQAPAAGPLESKLEARKVSRAADGSERYSAADTARPGDVIEYVATYRNTGPQPLRNVEATLPIPEGTEFISGTAKPGPSRVSADGLAYGAPPLIRMVKREGKEFVESVPPRDYKSLRWNGVTLEPRQSVTYVARVRLREAP